MDMIKIEFPSDRPDIARHLGAALTAIGSDNATLTADNAFSFERLLENLSVELNVPVELLRGKALNAEVSDTTEQDTASVIGDAGSNDNGGFNQEELDESETLGKRDPKGVAFNVRLCANASKPFYASGGKRSGQWKKRQGVGDDEYEGWYANELANLAPATSDEGDESNINTADAFGGQGGGDTAAPAVPHDAGTLMAWVSEMQSAGRVTQEMVNAAYTQAGITMTDIFEGPGKTPDVIAGRVGEIHNILQGWAQQ